MDQEKVLATVEEGIGWITFNNPVRHNAMSLAMWQSLTRIVEDLEAARDVRVMVMKGAGDKAFVAGADISEFETCRGDAEQVRIYNGAISRALTTMAEAQKPLLAMIRGYCVGGGLAIALSADVRIAADDLRCGIPAAKLGLGYDYEGVARLADVVGPSHALDILMTGRLLDASEAKGMGLANRVAAPGELEAAVRQYAASIIANAPLTIAAVKAAIREYLTPPQVRDLGKVERMVQACFDSRDYQEGRRAFMEKRPPIFSGR